MVDSVLEVKQIKQLSADGGATVVDVQNQTVDIDGGTIDGTVIGGTTPAAGTFTTFTSTGIDDNASSTALTIDASGNVSLANTLSAGTIGGGVSMASSGLTVRNIEQVALTSDQSLGNNGTLTTFFSPTYTPKFSGSKVMGCLNGVFYLSYLGIQDGRKVFVMSFSGSDITNIDYGANQQIGGYDHGGSGGVITTNFTTMGPLLTTSGTSTITCDCKLQNGTTSAASSWIVFGNNTLTETFFTWIEFK